MESVTGKNKKPLSGFLVLKKAINQEALFKAGLFEVLRTAFDAFALRAFRNILQLSAFKQGFHDNFAAARTKELVRRNGRTRVLACSTHV
jgi:hypothetical protein